MGLYPKLYLSFYLFFMAVWGIVVYEYIQTSGILPKKTLPAPNLGTGNVEKRL